MAINVNKAVAEIAQQVLIPGYYLGVKDKSVDKRAGNFWRGLLFPAANDIQHDKEYMFWHEFRDQYPTLMPTDVAPCEEGDSISTEHSVQPRYVTQGYWHTQFPVTCDFSQFLLAGENPYQSRSFQASIEDYFLDLREKMFGGFNDKEEYWASRLATTGKLIINPKGGPKYEVSFKRDNDLNLQVESGCSWCSKDVKDFDGETAPKARPWDDFRRGNDALWQKNRGGVDLWIMSLETANDMRQCINMHIAAQRTGRAIDILFPDQARLAGVEMPPEFDGARVEFFVRHGARVVPVYVVETNFTFCEGDKEICVNTMSDGVMYGFNLRNGNNTFGGRFSYGRIHNFHADQVMMQRFFHQDIARNGKSMKQYGESAPMALIECPNASVQFIVCPEKYKAPKV